MTKKMSDKVSSLWYRCAKLRERLKETNQEVIATGVDGVEEEIMNAIVGLGEVQASLARIDDLLRHEYRRINKWTV